MVVVVCSRSRRTFFVVGVLDIFGMCRFGCVPVRPTGRVDLYMLCRKNENVVIFFLFVL